MIDIDHFKQFNDTLGHQAGDECLQRVAQCLSDSLRNMDIVGRYGGEEFIILAPQSSLATGHILANRVRAQIQDLNITHKASGTAEMVTISLGVAEGPAEQWEDVVKKADEALYTAKKNGRNRVCVYETELSGASSASNKIPA